MARNAKPVLSKLVQTIHNAVGLPSAGGWLIRTLPFWDIHLLHERIIHRLTRNQLPVELGRVAKHLQVASHWLARRLAQLVRHQGKSGQLSISFILYKARFSCRHCR